MDYWENLRTLVQMAGESGYQDDPDFLAIIPACIASAENRILRDLDLLSTRVTDSTGMLTPNRKLFVLPTDVGTFIVVEQVRVITPNPAGPGTPGIFGPPLLPVSKDTIDWLWPDENAPTSPSIPTMWCPNDQASVFVAQPPDQDYFASVFGTMRPAPLSPQNPTTFISSQLADVFLAAQMIFISAEQKNWSAMADDPQSALSWNNEYERLLRPSLVEEARKKLLSVGWSARLPSAPVDTPPMPRS